MLDDQHVLGIDVLVDFLQHEHRVGDQGVERLDLDLVRVVGWEAGQ